MKRIVASLVGILLVAGVGAAIGACTGETPAAGCGTGSTSCGGVCTVLARDSANCGACGKVCGAGEVCSQGTCATSCGGGTSACGSACADLKSDSANCGACGKACAAGTVCTKGACAQTCGAGENACGQSCVDLKTDRANCGACATTCAAGEVCTAGACTLSCQAGLSLCTPEVSDGGVSDAASEAGEGGSPLATTYCANLASDDANCGACHTACADGTKCVNGACSPTCGAGLKLCSGKCVATQSDPANCGNCGVACGNLMACVAGTCAPVGTHNTAVMTADYSTNYTGCGDNSNYSTANFGAMTYSQCEDLANKYGAQFMGQVGFFGNYAAPYASSTRWVGEADANNAWIGNASWATVTSVAKSTPQNCILAYANGAVPGKVAFNTVWPSANGRAYYVQDFGVISEKICYTNALASGARPLNPWMFSASTKSTAFMVENHQNHGSTLYTGLGTFTADGGCQHTYRCLLGYLP